jgi:sodium/bile acid cotransporter 7
LQIQLMVCAVMAARYGAREEQVQAAVATESSGD